MNREVKGSPAFSISSCAKSCNSYRATRAPTIATGERASFTRAATSLTTVSSVSLSLTGPDTGGGVEQPNSMSAKSAGTPMYTGCFCVKAALMTRSTSAAAFSGVSIVLAQTTGWVIL